MNTNAAEKILPNEKSEFIEAFRTSFTTGNFVRITLSKSENQAGARRAVGRPVEIGGSPKISFEFEYDKRMETKNYGLEDAVRLLEDVASVEFRALTLFTPEADLLLQFTKKGLGRIFRSKPTFKEAKIQQHNRAKEYIISADQPYLRHLGISSPSGTIRSDKTDKLRQINKFIETFESLIKNSSLTERQELRVLDYGSGKSYLTFAIYDYLTRRRNLTTASVVGVEQRRELVDQCNQICKTVEFRGLEFRQGSIGDVAATKYDVVVALHACDTATDDAIAQAIQAKVPVIAVAPCCQKYVRPRMKAPASLSFIADHGIMEERLAESVTNGLRALMLQAHGYTTKVFEFISDSHTAKNVMITAVLTGDPRPELCSKIMETCKTFGLKDFYLDAILAAGRPVLVRA